MSTYGYAAPKKTVYQPTNAGWGAASLAPKQLATLNPSGTTTLGWTTAQGQDYSRQTGGTFHQQTSGGGPSYYSPPSYNWQNDPFLMETKALTAKSRTEAEAQKNDQLRKHILSSGLASLAEKLFGGDAAFIQSVRDNPFSGVGEIKNMYEGVGGRINQANEQLNQDNLFFSSHRTGVALPAIYRQRQADEYDLTNQTQSAIDSVNAAYTNRLEQLRLQEMEAERDAMMRAMQMGMVSGVGPSSMGGSGGSASGDNGAGLVGRPGEWADLPVLQGWNPYRNSDAVYDMSGATKVPGGYIGPQGQRYDEKGRVI